jgi:hypothetical protein
MLMDEGARRDDAARTLRLSQSFAAVVSSMFGGDAWDEMQKRLMDET